jgi:NAD(P)H-dependent FMN reductase
MSKPHIGIIVSTTRTGRFADKPLAWIRALASARTDMQVDALDLRDYPLPFFDEPINPASAPPKNEVAQRWDAAIAQCDGFIFLTAEYNHGMPAVLKNALDYAYKEFNRKPAAYVSYGGVGGTRSVEHLRLINIAQQMMPINAGVHIGGPDFVGMLMHGKTFADSPHLEPAARAMLDELAWWSRVLKDARATKQ